MYKELVVYHVWERASPTEYRLETAITYDPDRGAFWGLMAVSNAFDKRSGANYYAKRVAGPTLVLDCEKHGGRCPICEARNGDPYGGAIEVGQLHVLLCTGKMGEAEAVHHWGAYFTRVAKRHRHIMRCPPAGQSHIRAENDDE